MSMKVAKLLEISLEKDSTFPDLIVSYHQQAHNLRLTYKVAPISFLFGWKLERRWRRSIAADHSEP